MANENNRIENSAECRKTNNAVKNGGNKSIVVKKGSSKVAMKKKNAGMHAVRAPRVVNVKKEDKAPFPWSIVLVALLMTGLFLFMMMNYAEVDKYRSETTELQKQITTMEKTQKNLEVELNNKLDQTQVRQYALDELGMVHVNELPNSNIHYITVEQEDKTEMHTYDDGEEGGFGFLLAGFGEVIRDFFNN